MTEKLNLIPRQLLASVPQWGQKENPGCLASCTLALTCKVAISNLWPPRPGSLYIFPIPATIVSIPLSSFRGEFRPTLKFSFPSLNLENRHSSRRLFPPVLVTFLCHHLLTLPPLSTYHHPTVFLPSPQPEAQNPTKLHNKVGIILWESWSLLLGNSCASRHKSHKPQFAKAQNPTQIPQPLPEAQNCTKFHTKVRVICTRPLAKS